MAKAIQAGELKCGDVMLVGDPELQADATRTVLTAEQVEMDVTHVVFTDGTDQWLPRTTVVAIEA